MQEARTDMCTSYLPPQGPGPWRAPAPCDIWVGLALAQARNASGERTWVPQSDSFRWKAPLLGLRHQKHCDNKNYITHTILLNMYIIQWAILCYKLYITYNITNNTFSYKYHNKALQHRSCKEEFWKGGFCVILAQNFVCMIRQVEQWLYSKIWPKICRLQQRIFTLFFKQKKRRPDKN